MRNCIRCAKCVTVCPMGLNPAFLMRDVQYADWDATEKGYIVDCIECGSCSYTCPANRPLLDYIRTGKQKVSRPHPCTQKLTLPYGSPHYIPFPPHPQR